jgi:MFS family permease
MAALATALPAMAPFIGPMTTRIGAVILAVVAICLIISFFALVVKSDTPIATNVGLGIAMTFFTGLSIYMFYHSSVQLTAAYQEHGKDLVGLAGGNLPGMGLSFLTDSFNKPEPSNSPQGPYQSAPPNNSQSQYNTGSSGNIGYQSQVKSRGFMKKVFGF